MARETRAKGSGSSKAAASARRARQPSRRAPSGDEPESLVQRAIDLCQLVIAAAGAGTGIVQLYNALMPLVDSARPFIVPEYFWDKGLRPAKNQPSKGVALLKEQYQELDRSHLIAKVSAFPPSGRAELAAALSALESV